MYGLPERLAVQSAAITGAGWQWACALRSSVPGIVLSFDPVKQTCVVQVAIQEVVLKPPPNAQVVDGRTDTSQNIPTTVSIAPLQDVPIAMMRVLGWSLTLPITAGSECLLIFSDTCIDGWWAHGAAPGNGAQPPYDRRRHDLSDAIALFGPWSQPKTLANYSTTAMQLRSDDQTVMVSLAPGALTLTAPVIKAQATLTPAQQHVVTADFYAWFNTNVLPFLISNGYSGPNPPADSVTTVFEAQ